MSVGLLVYLLGLTRGIGRVGRVGLWGFGVGFVSFGVSLGVSFVIFVIFGVIFVIFVS